MKYEPNPGDRVMMRGKTIGPVDMDGWVCLELATGFNFVVPAHGLEPDTRPEPLKVGDVVHANGRIDGYRMEPGKLMGEIAAIRDDQCTLWPVPGVSAGPYRLGDLVRVE